MRVAKVQQAKIKVEATKKDFLKANAFDNLANYSDQMILLLNDQLYIQAINQKACDLFSVELEDVRYKHLPTWFFEQGWVPPIVYFNSMHKHGLNKKITTKIIKNNEDIVVSWEFDYLNASSKNSNGIILKVSLVPENEALNHQKALIERSSLIDAINDHLKNLSSLAQQALSQSDQGALALKISLQHILSLSEQSQALLSFSSRLEKVDSVSTKQEGLSLHKTLQSIIDDYQVKHASMMVQISLAIKQSAQKKNIICPNESFVEGLSALILPLMNFFDKGQIDIQLNQRKVNQKSGLVHMQIHLRGVDAFGYSIEEWLFNKAEECHSHKTLYLHWLLGRAWLENNYGCYQLQSFSSEVHIDLFFPCEFELMKVMPNVASTTLHEKNVSLKKSVQLNYKTDLDPLTQQARKPSDASILFIEDNEMNRRVVLQMVHRLFGHIYFKVAANAADAVEAYKKNQYDLILMDIGLPDNDGLQLAYALRELEQRDGRSPAPICVLSAHYSYDNYRNDCKPELRDQLLQDFYAKPLMPDQAKSLIETYLPQIVKKSIANHA